MEINYFQVFPLIMLQVTEFKFHLLVYDVPNIEHVVGNGQSYPRFTLPTHLFAEYSVKLTKVNKLLIPGQCTSRELHILHGHPTRYSER